MAVYLDYCASAPIDDRVLQTMIDVYHNVPGNADSRTHIYGTKAKELVLKSRRTVAEILNVDLTEVIFTSGATESDNMAILGLANYGLKTGKKHIITSAFEHKAVLSSMKKMESLGFEVEYILPESDGRISAENLLERVRQDTLLVSLMHVNNETGVIQPIVPVGKALEERNVLFHIDAAQSFGKLNNELRAGRYDMLSLSGHKIHGPQGIGALIIRRKRYKRPPIEALFYGGQQEYGYRPGTTPVALVAGLAKAAQLMEDEYATHKAHLLQTKQMILDALLPLGGKVNGSIEHALPNVLNISIPGIDAEAVFAGLKDDYALSNGSACTSGSYAPSYVLKAMGFDEQRISEALRVSWWIESVDMSALINYVKDMQ